MAAFFSAEKRKEPAKGHKPAEQAAKEGGGDPPGEQASGDGGDKGGGSEDGEDGQAEPAFFQMDKERRTGGAKEAEEIDALRLLLGEGRKKGEIKDEQPAPADAHTGERSGKKRREKGSDHG